MEHGRLFDRPGTSGERNVLKILKNLEHPIIFDCGANKGQYASLCLETLGENLKLHCFEPSKAAFKVLQDNIGGNNNVQLNNMAVSDKRQKLTLNYFGDGNLELASVLDCDYENWGISVSGSEQVEAVTIDEYCKENRLDEIDLLKLDVEGYDYQALLGAKKLIESNKIKMIQFEISKSAIDAKVFYKDFYLLLKERYSFYRILTWGFVELPVYSHEYELFFGSNYLAVNKLSEIIP